MAVDTPSEVSKLYDAVQKYLDAVAGFHGDPASPLGEPQDYLNGIFLDTLVRSIQSRIDSSASRSEGAMLTAYRDVESLQHEYELRLTTRKGYLADAATEAKRVGEQWKYSHQVNKNLLQGRELVQR